MINKFNPDPMKLLFPILLTIIVCFLSPADVAAQGLKLRYADHWGLSGITYNGQVFMDVDQRIGAPVSLESYLASPAHGKPALAWSYVGGTTWDDAKKTYTLQCPWGSIASTYLQKADTLFIRFTFTNTSVKDTFNGLSFCPFALHFNKRPGNFTPLFPYYANNRLKPTVINADLGNYQIVLENADLDNHSYLGFVEENNSNGTTYRVWTGNNGFIGMTDFDGRSYLRLAPKQVYSYTVAVKFIRDKSDLARATSATMAKFTTANPFLVKWADRRPVGMLFLSSFNTAIDNTNNPRRWVVTKNNVVDVRSTAGKKVFRDQVMDFANNSLSILKEMGAQGMITWDVEGQQFPHPLSYIGSPELLAVVAPEMNDVADEYFKRFSDNGFKTGICIRPDSVVFNKDKSWIDHVAVRDPAATLIRKIAYAKKRWGISIFYVDSNFGSDDKPMDPAIFKKVMLRFPDILLMPEHKSPLYYSYTAPYAEFRGGSTLVAEDIRRLYPKAFMAFVVPEGFPANSTTEKQMQILRDSYKQGNIFLFRAWYRDEPVNSMIRKIVSGN